MQRSRLEGRDDNHTIFLTPESCISCPLNREPALCSFIQSGMQPGQTLLLASQYQDEANLLYQAVYLITSDNTSPIYLKQHAIPCIERIPRYFKKNAWLRTIFRSENDFSCAQEQVISNGFLLNGMWVIPRLCSDFFLVTSVADLDKLRLSHDEPLVVVLLVNDTWFAPYMRSLLYQVARMRAWLAQVELVYVGYASDSSRLVRRKDFL